MGGPWFTVLRDGDTWKTLAKLSISDGDRDIEARVEARVRLEVRDEEN